MSTDKTAPAAQWTTPAAKGAGLGRFALALDPETGHLYPVPGTGALTFRADPETGNLIASDDTELPAARTAVLGSRAMIY